MGKYIGVLLIGFVLAACAGSSEPMSIVKADDNALNCLQIEHEISTLRKQRRDTLESVFYTDRNLVDAATQRIRYLKTMHSYNKCSEGNPEYTKVILASLM